MIYKIIETEKKDLVKAEFERIRMPDESKERILKQLLADQKEREAMPENAVKAEAAEGAKISGSRSFASIAAAAVICIIGLWALVFFDGRIKSDENEDPPAAVDPRAESSAADSSGQFGWSVDLENNLANPLPGAVRVDFMIEDSLSENNMFLEYIEDICIYDDETYVMYCAASKDSFINAIFIGRLDESAEEIIPVFSTSMSHTENDKMYGLNGGFTDSLYGLNGGFTDGGAYLNCGGKLYGYNFSTKQSRYYIDLNDNSALESGEYYRSFAQIETDTVYLLSSGQSVNEYLYQVNSDGTIVRYDIVTESGDNVDENTIININTDADGGLLYDVTFYDDDGEMSGVEFGYFNLTDNEKCIMTPIKEFTVGQGQVVCALEDTDDSGNIYYTVTKDDRISLVRLNREGQETEIFSEAIPEEDEGTYTGCSFYVSENGEYFVRQKYSYYTSEYTFVYMSSNTALYDMDTNAKLAEWNIENPENYGLEPRMIPVITNRKALFYHFGTVSDWTYVYEYTFSEDAQADGEAG